MKLTLEMLLYFIRNLNPIIFHKCERERAFLGVKQFYPEEAQMELDYLYVGKLSEICQTQTQLCRAKTFFEEDGVARKGTKTFLTVNDLLWGEKEIRQLPDCFILLDETYKIPYLMNRMIDLFQRMAAWDKQMHIAVLEGREIQSLVEISEPVLERPMIIFDAGFSVIAYTKQIVSTYTGFQKTIEKGYSEAGVMEKIRQKQILKQLKPGEALLASSAEDEGLINIYQSFYSDQTLLGYICVSYGSAMPEDGYLDLFQQFSENLVFCLKRDYENRRYGQMMYETFLSHLIHSEHPVEEQFLEQLHYIEGLSETGRFVLAAIRFEAAETVPLAFLTRMIARQFWNMRPFLYQKHICLLKILEEAYGNPEAFSEGEIGKIQEILLNYGWRMGISNVFTRITDLRFAFRQSCGALSFGSLKHSGIVSFHHSTNYYFYLFSAAEKTMPAELFRTEAYLELKKYDAAHGKDLLDTILCYLEHDCNATHTAEALFLHRNTVRNTLQFAQERFGLDITDPEQKRLLLLSNQADQYLRWKLQTGVLPCSDSKIKFD